MQHLHDLVLSFEPAGDIERAGLMLLHTDGQRPQAARHEERVVARGEKAQQGAR